MVDLGADTNPLAQAVVMVAGHMGQHSFAGGQAQRIKKFRAAKGLAGDLRFHRRVVVMHDVVGAQQHVAGPVCKRTGQRAFGHVGQLAQRCIDQGVAVHLADQGMGKHAVANELGDKARSRSVIERVGVVPLVQAALLHHADLVANGKSLELVVGYKQRRGVGRLEDAAHLVGEPLAQVNIEVGERLVEQQQAWLGCQGSGQGHALLLPAREFMCEAALLAGQADQGQHLVNPACPLSPWQVANAKANIALDIEVREQRVILEHHANLARLWR